MYVLFKEKWTYYRTHIIDIKLLSFKFVYDGYFVFMKMLIIPDVTCVGESAYVGDSGTLITCTLTKGSFNSLKLSHGVNQLAEFKDEGSKQVDPMGGLSVRYEETNDSRSVVVEFAPVDCSHDGQYVLVLETDEGRNEFASIVTVLGNKITFC